MREDDGPSSSLLLCSSPDDWCLVESLILKVLLVLNEDNRPTALNKPAEYVLLCEFLVY